MFSVVAINQGLSAVPRVQALSWRAGAGGHSQAEGDAPRHGRHARIMSGAWLGAGIFLFPISSCLGGQSFPGVRSSLGVP